MRTTLSIELQLVALSIIIALANNKRAVSYIMARLFNYLLSPSQLKKIKDTINEFT